MTIYFRAFSTCSKTLTGFLVAMAASVTSVSTYAEGKGLIPGFRGITWGDPVAKLGLVDPVPKTNECFFRKSEKLTINEIEITDVRYCFTNGKLSMVAVNTKSRTKAIRSAIIDAYGQPRLEVDGYATWGSDQEVDGGTAALLSPSKHGAALILKSNKAAIDEKIQKIVKARKDF